MLATKRFSPRAGIRGFDTAMVMPRHRPSSIGSVSVPERGFVALIPAADATRQLISP